MVLYDYQKKALEELKTGSILCGGVGSGKSITALAWYMFKLCGGSVNPYKEMWTKRDLYVITTARKRDTHEWEQDAIEFMLTHDPDTSHSGVKFIVDSWNNIAKYKDVSGACFLFDEQRVVGSGKWVKVFLNLARKNRWLLLSATPGDVYTDYIPVLVANGFYKNKSEFQKQHCIFARYVTFPKIERFIDTDVLDARIQSIMVVMKDQRHTVRNMITKTVRYDKELWDVVAKERWNPWDEEPIQETGKLCYLMRKVSNYDYARLDTVLEILKEHPKAIVFYNFTYELNLLRAFLGKHKIVYQEWNGEKHEPVPQGKAWAYLVQYAAGAEAWNCITTDTVIFYSLNYSYRTMEQARGRIDRANTPFIDLWYYSIVSESPIDKAILRALEKKETFNEKKFIGL